MNYYHIVGELLMKVGIFGMGFGLGMVYAVRRMREKEDDEGYCTCEHQATLEPVTDSVPLLQ